MQTVLGDAARVFGPQKGATPPVVEQLDAALAHWADVVAAELGDGDLTSQPGTGAAGGLGYGLAAALHARLVPGALAVADLVDLDAHLARADVVITGEGRLDATSLQGKVVGEVLQARRRSRHPGRRGRRGRGRGRRARRRRRRARTCEDPDEADEQAAKAGARLAERLGPA